MGSIIMEVQDQVVTITINNPGKMNCFNWSMLNELDNSIQNISRDKTVRVLKIQAVGGKAFSTGADLNEFKKLDHEGIASWIKLGNKIFNNLETLAIPTVAVIDGYALGGGLELTLACDIRIATSTSQFSFPELKHGWIPGWGGLSRLRRLIGESRAKQMILLCVMIDAPAAQTMGIIHRLCKNEELNQVVDHLISHLKGIDPLLMEMAKNALMDSSKGTNHNDLLFDVLASQYSRGKDQKS